MFSEAVDLWRYIFDWTMAQKNDDFLTCESDLQGVVHVRLINEEEKLKITLNYKVNLEVDNNQPSAEHVDHIFFFDRLQNEMLQKTLDRMSVNLMKRLGQKKRDVELLEDGEDILQSSRKHEAEKKTFILSLYNGTLKIPGETINSKAWKEGTHLFIGEKYLKVCLNIPTIKSIMLPNSIMSGFPQTPRIDAEFVDLTRSKFEWFKSLPTKHVEKDHQHGEIREAKNNIDENSDNHDWRKLHTGFCFAPSNNEIGERLKIVCLPVGENGTKGHIAEAFCKCEVTAGPGFCPFETRHAFTQKMSEIGRYMYI